MIAQSLPVQPPAVMADAGVAVSFNSSFMGFYAHAGFLDGLVQLGIQPVAVSGASGGSFVAGLYAAGMSPAEIIALSLSRQLRKALLREWPKLWRIFGTVFNRPGCLGVLTAERAVAILRE